ncbi:MAG: hypothetical protein U5L96_21135 [Owenweeksia sp.]|nr:hypothetical protein [Owenweeksia sp.]
MQKKHKWIIAVGNLLLVVLFLSLPMSHRPLEGESMVAHLESQSTIADSNDLSFRKTIPSEVKVAAFKALRHYPELADIRISFEYDEEFNNSFMQAQPIVSSFFKDRKDRAYRIKMTRHMMVNDSMIPVEEVPAKVLVGRPGHELGHIMDYTTRSSINMVWFGMRYLTSDKYKREAEHKADLYAIKHGLSEEIIATKKYILNNASLPKRYRQKIRRLYLSPENVLSLVNELEGKVLTKPEKEKSLSLNPTPTW